MYVCHSALQFFADSKFISGQSFLDNSHRSSAALSPFLTYVPSLLLVDGSQHLERAALRLINIIEKIVKLPGRACAHTINLIKSKFTLTLTLLKFLDDLASPFYFHQGPIRATPNPLNLVHSILMFLLKPASKVIQRCGFFIFSLRTIIY